MPGTDTGPRADAGDAANVIEGETITLNGSDSSPESAGFSWEQIITEGERNVRIHNADSASATFNAPLVPAGTSRVLEFQLTVTHGGASSTDRVRVTVSPSTDKVDADGDGLIEIDSLEMLHNMLYNLAGTSYDTDLDDTGGLGGGPGGIGLTDGCPRSACKGYELTRNLDFDTDGDGTWSGEGTTDSPFVLDTDDNNSTYFPIPTNANSSSANVGWEPIGRAPDRSNFKTIFEGNGHSISNVVIRSNRLHIGFFGRVDSSTIRNIGLVNALVLSTDTAGNVYVGALGGEIRNSTISSSYATGTVIGSLEGVDLVGLLLGGMHGTSRVTHSHASGTVSGGGGDSDRVGGLVGILDASTATYASYAKVNATGGGGDNDNVGGLVGQSDMLDPNVPLIVASYATGTANGGAMTTGNSVGALIGTNNMATITNSYGFGATSNGTDNSSTVGAPPMDVTASGLTAGNAGAAWNNADSHTLGAWDFGTAMQDPVLRYADYDGPDGDVYSCDGEMPTVPEGLCGTIIPGQGR